MPLGGIITLQHKHIACKISCYKNLLLIILKAMQEIKFGLVSAVKRNAVKTLFCILASTAAQTTTAKDFAANATTVTGNATTTPGIKGMDDVVGLTLDGIKAQAVTAGSFPEDDMNKIFFLYNVKTGKFLNSGGYWGTHVSLKDYPLPFWVNANANGTIEFSQEMGTGEGHLLGWMGGTDTTQPDNGVFIDRQTSDNTHYGWTFEATNDGKNTYKIYTYATNSPSANHSSKFYLCANKGVTDQDKNCGAVTSATISDQELAGYDEWRIISMQQLFKLQDENTDNMTSSLDLSFKLKCPGFSRGRKDIGSWITKTFSSTGSVRYGLEHAYNTTAKVSGDTYDSGDYFGNGTTYSFEGKTFSDQKTYLQQAAKYFCMDAKDVRGVIYQDVKVMHGGSYVIECKGYSTTKKAKLFAVLLDSKQQKITHTVHQTVLSQVEYMSKNEQSELHTDEQNMDYAGKSFYGSRKYINSVLVQVPEATDDEPYHYIRFGVLIGDDDDDTVVEGSDEWTVFDDFRLLYASKTIDEDLILDEDRADLSYLKECSNTYKNKVLHLKKTFTRDKWNSIVLPVSLTRDQFMQAFGANAKLAKLALLTSDEIQFETINMDAQQSTDTVFEAYTPYIIFPTKYLAVREAPAYKALLTKTGSTEAKSYPLVIEANHIDIPNVTFATDRNNYNDLSNINTDTWTTNKMYDVEGNGTMTAYGTFVRTFGIDVTQDTDESHKLEDSYGQFTFNDRKIRDGYDDLKGSFFFANGNLYTSSTRQRGLRGFSCWFKPTDSSLAPNMIFYLDGISQGGVTAISDVISFGNDSLAGKAAQGVFTISGQKISSASGMKNLPAGMYIVNGKKYIAE